SLYVIISSATSGGTAPGGTSAPTGCTLTSPSDISAFVTGIDQGVAVETLEATTFGSGGFKAFVAGLRSGNLDLTLMNDYAAAQLNALIGLNGSVRAVGSSSPLFIEVRPSSAARSGSNPGFVCAALSIGFSTFAAQVGQIPMANWKVQITGGFAELTA
ncbi:hypothetical protein EBZ38_15340, partial [bacterium]|nr:hypothetical protein [bacterium]